MKRIIFALSLCSMFLQAQAGPAVQKQKVYSIVKQYQPVEWHQEQLHLWEEEVKNNPQNADAWMNIYTATRMIKLMGGPKTQKDMDAVAEAVKKNIPDTFEGHYIQYWNSDHSDTQFTHLLKAYGLDPSRPETYDDFVSMYELKRDKTQLKEFCEKWFFSNDISPGFYAWNYNMLMSCDENAILITNGDNDTYPALVLQYAKNIRKDVAVINTHLITKKEYRDLYFREMGIPAFTEGNQTTDKISVVQSICSHIQKYSSRPFYYANTVDPVYYGNIESNLYSVGLTFKYSKDGFDNVAVLRRNYEKRFLTDYLKVDFDNDISQSVIDHLNGSYLAPFITLYNHYAEAEETAQQEILLGFVNHIADKTGQAEEVNKMISGQSNTVVSYVITDPRDAMYGMIKINDTLYASQYETSNFMYNKFLEDLLKQKRYSDLMTAKMDKVEWEKMLAPMYSKLTFEEYFKHGKPEDDRFPVSNITYEAAQLYCDWLTKIYNNIEHKKKTFKKVKFRLPTEKEWEWMARCGMKNDNKYPWGYLKDTEDGFKRDTITNQKGCFLANVQTNREVNPDPNVCPSHDGGIFPVLNYSYHPTDWGLYCMIGNVAEMVQEKGIAKGGGWNTLAEDAAIGKQQKYNGPDTNVGFRVVMEIVEK
ncbi:MAG: formylglycine-generating enzyme family protein [Bacteroidota bacterium]